jgi:hypothetical protein
MIVNIHYESKRVWTYKIETIKQLLHNEFKKSILYCPYNSCGWCSCFATVLRMVSWGFNTTMPALWPGFFG